nr:hypothetical protein [uncultured Carboxylicivirga sp.]
MRDTKKKYSKPSIEEYNLDCEISLIMTSLYDPDEPFPFNSAKVPESGGTIISKVPSAQSNPFGGDKPDYGD